MLREVIQRHTVRQPLALKWLVRQLESAFLIQYVGVVGVPIDPVLLPLDELEGRSNRGHTLATAVLLDFRRRGAEVGYLRTSKGFEVDVLARFPDGRRALGPAGVARSAGSERRLAGCDHVEQC